jgi:ABC-type transporter Mla maintaining outer membrane lipid asymmetry permease subunit MlaE
MTLGISPRVWTLLPSLAAALLAAPLLTVIGTILSLYWGGIVGPLYGICTWREYRTEVRDATFPTLRLTALQAYQSSSRSSLMQMFASLDLTTTHSKHTNAWYIDTLIEIATYPPIFHWIKSCTFIILIMLVAEVCSRWTENLTPRGVPGAITSTVVIGSLAVIVADWGFSQLLLQRY